MKLRGAVYGCGMISEFHLRGWSRIPEVEIVALCNRTPAKAEQRREQFAPLARVYSDLGAMLGNERLDFIDILTTPALHREHCIAAMRAGLHIICQKPLCGALEEARLLAGELSDYPKIFAIHENHRYRPWFQSVLERMRQGFFGEPYFLQIQHLNATEPGEAYKNDAEAGVLLEYGSHLVDMMRSALGEPTGVYCRMHHFNPHVRGESLVHAVYEYRNCTAVLDAGWKHAALTQGSMLLAGDLGEAWYEGTLTRGATGRLRITEGDRVVVDKALSPYDEYVESFYLFEREYVDAMLGRGQVVQTAEEHLKSLACSFAAYHSAAVGEVRKIAC
jgi:D-apiose dehydrogenase